jgi:hypothetical protein
MPVFLATAVTRRINERAAINIDRELCTSFAMEGYVHDLAGGILTGGKNNRPFEV